MTTHTVPLQAYRRGLSGFDGSSVLGVKVCDATDAAEIQAAGSNFYFGIYAFFPDESTGTGCHCLRDGSSSGASSDGWSIWYNNNAGSGKLYAAISKDGSNFSFGVDWTADGDWHLIEFEYSFSGTSTYAVYIDGVLQVSYNTGGTHNTFSVTTQDVALFETRDTHNGSTPAAAVKGSTVPVAGSSGTNYNLVPNGFKVLWVREEASTPGTAAYELWFDAASGVGTDQTTTYTPSFYGTGATAPTNIAAEFTVTLDGGAVSDGVADALGKVAVNDTYTLTITNTGDCIGWVESGSASGGISGSDPTYPFLLAVSGTKNITITIDDATGTGSYTMSAFSDDWLSDSGSDGDFVLSLTWQVGGAIPALIPPIA